MKKREIKKYISLIVIFMILSILFVFPLFKWNYFPFGDDMDFNIDRVLELKNNFIHLNFNPQISTYTFRNVAYPINAFYPWYTLVPFAIFQIIIPNQVWGFIIGFAFYAFIGLIIAYIVVYKITKNKTQAFFTSICYIFSEYISINAFRRFDFGEFIGMILMPIAFYGFYEVMTERSKNGWIILGLGMSLLILTHILSTFIVTVCLFILFLIFFKKVKDKKSTICNLIKSIFIFIGSSGIFLFPFIYQNLTQHFQSQKNMISVGYYPQGFGTLILTSLNSECNDYHYGIGIFGILILILGLIYFKKLSNLSKILYISGCVTFFMASTAFPWYLLDNTIFSVIQFPYRLLMLTSMFYAFVGGELIQKVINSYSQNVTHSHLLISLCFIAGLVIPQIGQTQLLLQNTNEFRNGVGFNKDSGIYEDFGSFRLEMYAPLSEQDACPDVYDHVAKINGISQKLSDEDIKPYPNSIVYSSKELNSANNVVLPILYYNDMFKAERNGENVKVYRAANGQLAIKSSNLGPIKVSYKYNWTSITGIISTILCWGFGIVVLCKKKKG